MGFNSGFKGLNKKNECWCFLWDWTCRTSCIGRYRHAFRAEFRMSYGCFLLYYHVCRTALWSSWKFISYFEFEGRNWYILFSLASTPDLPTSEDQITTRCHETSGTLISRRIAEQLIPLYVIFVHESWLFFRFGRYQV